MDCMAATSPIAPPRLRQAAWWERRWFGAALILLAAVPLLYPPIPPLVDLPAHVARYQVELDLDSSPWLQRYYEFRWLPIGNLGVDLLIVPFAKLLGLEAGLKFIAISMVALTAAGFLWVAREAHGRIPPTTLFALPFAYGHHFQFGFLNYALSMALALLAFAFWLRLSRLGRLRTRALLFVPISVLIFFAHAFGWGVLGLLCLSAETVRQREEGASWGQATLLSAVQVAVLALPLVMLVAWRSGGQGPLAEQWFDLDLKLQWLMLALRDRWAWFDFLSLVACLVLIVEARRREFMTFSPTLAASSLVLFAAFLLLPYKLLGSAYADMRLVPFAVALAVLAIRFKADAPASAVRQFAALGLGFFILRIAANSLSLAIAADDQGAKLEALGKVPQGARVASFVGNDCGNHWPLLRNVHLGSMVTVRRHGFSNDQWNYGGPGLLRLRYRVPGVFGADPSQLVQGRECIQTMSLDTALRDLPRGAFDYVWLIDTEAPPPGRLAGLTPVWRGADSILYRIHQ